MGERKGGERKRFTGKLFVKHRGKFNETDVRPCSAKAFRHFPHFSLLFRRTSKGNSSYWSLQSPGRAYLRK